MNKEIETKEFKFYKEHVMLLLADTEYSTEYENVKAAETPRELTTLFRSGILPSLLLESAKQGSVNKSAINWKIDPNVLASGLSKRSTELALAPDETKALFSATENLNVFIKSTRKAGIVVVNISAEDILSANSNLVFGLMWQIIKLALLKNINLDHHPELVRLLKGGETISNLVSLTDEALLERWSNYHLERAQSKKRVKGFGSELRDGIALIQISQMVIPEHEVEACRIIENIRGRIHLERSNELHQSFLSACRLMSCKIALTPDDLVTGDSRSFIMCLATLFNKYTGIYLLGNEETVELLSSKDRLEIKCSTQELEIEMLKTKCEEFDVRSEQLKSVIEKFDIVSAELKSLKAQQVDDMSNLVSKFSTLCDDAKNKLSLGVNPKLDMKISKAFAQSQLAPSFSKQNICGLVTPLETSTKPITFSSSPELYQSHQLIRPLVEEVIAIVPCENSNDYEKVIIYLTCVEKCINGMYDVISEREKNLNDVVTRLERLINIDAVITQKIKEYTESFIMQKKK